MLIGTTQWRCRDRHGRRENEDGSNLRWDGFRAQGYPSNWSDVISHREGSLSAGISFQSKGSSQGITLLGLPEGSEWQRHSETLGKVDIISEFPSGSFNVWVAGMF